MLRKQVYLASLTRKSFWAILMFIPLSGLQTASAQMATSAFKWKAIQSAPSVKMTTDSYEDKVKAVWIAQIAGATMGFQFEHKTASTQWVDQYNQPLTSANVDDDWYYEMIAIRAFEKYGINMTVKQLGEQWMRNSAGSWGSSEQARLLMAKGIMPPKSGNPRYNKLWFTIGPQFSADVYGALAPGMPNVAGKLAREYCHINGYAEGADGGVFVAGMVSLGFTETDSKVIVKKAAKLINPASPYRQCLEMVIRLAEAGKNATEIFNAVEDRWHIEYPATNNAVANGGIVATSVWFGEGDFLKTVNLAFGAADFTDADCNAANAAAVTGAIHGMKGIPQNLVKPLGDRIKGEKMGRVVLTPPVDESISGLAHRTVAIGAKILQNNGAKLIDHSLTIPIYEPVTQPAELFKLSDLTQFWNPDWTLKRAGFGGAGGGMGGIRGITYLDSNVLVTYPRDEVRGLLLSRKVKLNASQTLSFDVRADAKRAWQLVVYVNNQKIKDQIIKGGENNAQWQSFRFDLSAYQGQTVTIRLYQRVLIDGQEAGNAYWRNLKIQ